MDEIEKECTDPREDFPKNIITAADRKRADTIRAQRSPWNDPGITVPDPLVDGPSTSGLGQTAVVIQPTCTGKTNQKIDVADNFTVPTSVS